MSYIINFEQIARDERQLKSIIGMGTQEFKFLIKIFQEMFEKMRDEEYENRKNMKGEKTRNYGGAKGKLDTYEKKLFMTLYYLKTYPTFDHLGFQFGMARSGACTNIHKFVVILAKALQELGVAPKREINSPEDWKEVFGKNINELIVDATERRHFRHKNNEKQKENYSGKKNATPPKTVS